MKSKNIAGLLAILFGWLGIHKFYLGYTTEGVIMLLISLLTGGTLVFVIWVIGLIEGIIYLTKSQEDFDRIYCQDKKGWF